MKNKDAEKIYSLLSRQYPDACDSSVMVCRGTPFEVLILTILSAQTTDVHVNKVTETLFKKYKTINPFGIGHQSLIQLLNKNL